MIDWHNYEGFMGTKLPCRHLFSSCILFPYQKRGLISVILCSNILFQDVLVAVHIVMHKIVA